MKQLSATSNDTIKKIVALHDAKGRKEQQQFIAHGIRTIQTLLQAGYQPMVLCATAEYYHQAMALAPSATLLGITDAVARTITPSTTASGIVATFAIPTTTATIGNQAVALVQLQDPGNMGTLIRTAVAMNISDVIIVEGCDPWHPKVIQATAGTIGFARIHSLRWQQLVALPQRPPLCAMVVQGGIALEQLPSKEVILVIGNEANGLTAQQIDDCPYRATLSMPGKAESLNAAIAGAIGLYLIQQR
ncbi:RNA methyltransferase [Candidatus Dependentiae bacterium]|nr:RNA methyltransferase [Candidatus Dependentiae bacterium]